MKADVTRRQQEFQTQNCTARVESETLKQVNADLTRQITSLNQDMVQLRSALPLTTNASQVDDLMELIEQMRTESKQKDAQYEEIMCKYQSYESHQSNQPSSPPPQPLPSQTPLRSQVLTLHGKNDKCALCSPLPLAIPIIESKALPRLTAGSDIRLMARSFLPVASGPDTAPDRNNDFLQKVIADFRKAMHSNLLRKGQIPGVEAN